MRCATILSCTRRRGGRAVQDHPGGVDSVDRGLRLQRSTVERHAIMPADTNRCAVSEASVLPRWPVPKEHKFEGRTG